MTRTEAMDLLDILDEYWEAKPRRVEQAIGRMTADHRIGALEPCGCFGAHVHRALQPGMYLWEFEMGWDLLTMIVQTLSGEGEHTDIYVVDLLAKEAGTDHPFSPDPWKHHPVEAWPRISERLREL